MTVGLTAAGFQAATLAELKAELEAALLSDVDPELDLDPDEPIGQINAIYANKLAELWELLHTAYGAFDESSALDSLLDAICALTGTYRILASKGRVTQSVTLVAGTVLPTTAAVHAVGDPNTKWVLDETEYPSGYTAAATGAHSLTFRCERTGPVAALAGSLVVIATPVTGWSLTSNAADAVPGTNRETNEELRIRRREELADLGQCTGPALRAALLRVEGVRSARVFENTTMSVDSLGLPPKSFEALIWDGVTPEADNAEVLETVWKNKPAGIESYGATIGTHVDEYGENRALAYTRATQVPIVVAFVAHVKTNFPLDGVDQMKAAIVAKAATLDFADDGTLGAISGAAMSVLGVTDITGLTLNGVAANVAIGTREIATIDSSDISISTVPA